MQQAKSLKIVLTTEDLLSVKDAAQLLGIHRVTLYRWIARGKIAVASIGRSPLIPKSEVARLTCSGETPGITA